MRAQTYLMQFALPLYFVAVSDGKPLHTFPETALRKCEFHRRFDMQGDRVEHGKSGAVFLPDQQWNFRTTQYQSLGAAPRHPAMSR
jgi:hypothetical protein